MRTAECNVCGLKWETVNDIGNPQTPRLRLEGDYEFQRLSAPCPATGHVDADLCSWECVIVFARMRMKGISP